MSALRIGTRGSKLALWQAREVARLLQAAWPGMALEERIVRTAGDGDKTSAAASFAVQGIFVKELQEALRRGDVDLAVHSAKDLPADGPDGLSLQAFLRRADARDALVTGGGVTLQDLPRGARLGTASPRRQAQLLHHRPDLRFSDLRGNVDTRLRILAEGRVDGLVLAMAGLTRLGRLGPGVSPLPESICVPAPGQGAIALEIRADDADTAGRLHPLDDAATRSEVEAERELMRLLEAGCVVPLGGLARLREDGLHLDAVVAAADGTEQLRASATAPPGRAHELGRQVADALFAQGAARLLDRHASSSGERE